MDIVNRIAQIIQEDGVVTDDEIMLLDQAIASDGEVTPEEIMLINFIATQISNHILERKPDQHFTKTDLQDLENAVILDDDISENQRTYMINAIIKLRDRVDG